MKHYSIRTEDQYVFWIRRFILFHGKRHPCALAAAEERLARPVNPNLMTRTEWRHKRAEVDSFAARIAAQPKVFVIGAEDDLV